MRLLNVFTGKLEEYFGSEMPRYAILSHTWGRDEITFADIQNIPDGAQDKSKYPPPEEPAPKLSISVPTRLKETLPEKEDPEAEVLISEPTPPERPLFKNKQRTDLDTLGKCITPEISSLANNFDLAMRYRKVKGLYFEKKAQLEQLQTKLEKHPLSRDELTIGRNIYVRSSDKNTSRSLNPIHPEEPLHENKEFTEMERLLIKYGKVKALYFEKANEVDHLQEVLASWESSLSQKSFPTIHNPSVQEKAGYQKILYASMQTIADGYQYVWIDTCCIDKSSTVELSEAINSMFQWYKKADVCYAYVEDVVVIESFGTSRWFTRGWTLQELLAPSDVVFFGAGWIRLGTKSDLAYRINEATGIDWETLLDQDWLRKNSVAQRMSWASRRETTRDEDAAYCLLGIFGVNMPLLYGEGKKAFIRLQEEIVKYSVDQSLFAWSITPGSYTYRCCGIFAQSPQNYQAASSIVSFQRTTDTAPYLMTNKGLQIELPLIEAPGYVLGLLDCQSNDEISTCFAIVLQRTHMLDVFFRIQGTSLSERPKEGGGLVQVTHEQASKAIMRKIYIPRDAYDVPLERSSYQIEFPLLEKYGFELVAARPGFEQANVKWNSLARSLHIVHDLRSSWRSIAFVFHNARTKMAFAVYFDEVALVNTERIPTEVWLSPLVNEPSHSVSPGLYTLKDWWHSLSYGIDDLGVAYQRHPDVSFTQIDDNGITRNFAISAHLETANHFGQKIGVLLVSLSPRTHPMTFSEGEYSQTDTLEPSSLATDWIEHSSLNVAGPASQISNAQPTSTIIESYSILEVVPSSLPLNIHTDRSSEKLPKAI